MPDATILIATFNRAAFLRETLDSLSALQSGASFSWDVVVVDNNSTDATSVVVDDARRQFPVPLRYIFEPRQGKSIALNTGIADIDSRVIVFTDDDVRVPAEWLEASVAPLLADGSYDYTGGPARAWWGGEPPAWLEKTGNQTAPLAAVDYGPEPFVFEERGTIPLGVNMAVRRSVFDLVGGFHPALGRTGRSLLGQEQAEFFQRCRAAGIRGLYVPGMVLEHYVPAERLSVKYFSRWWYWKGISQARWHRMHGRTETGVDLSKAPKLLGVPRYTYSTAAADLALALGALVRGDRAHAATRALLFVYFLGYCAESWRRRPVAES
ncbi:MAG TPA: glycosyltransferase [Vicinamibacterales bacterium]